MEEPIKKVRPLKTAFLLQHSYLLNDNEETKIIGIFTSRKTAEECIEKYLELPGFKDYPDCFFIDEYEIDKEHWKEGFITIT